jgi:hypothetical protein
MRAKSTSRTIIWREQKQEWACTECAWVFQPSGVLADKTLAEITQYFKEQRDQEFASHVCADCPRGGESPILLLK